MESALAEPQIERDYDVLAGIGVTMAEIVADWMVASGEAAAKADPAPITIAYGAEDKLAYELFLPRGRPRGAVIFLHGGFWVQGSKDSVLFPQRAFTDAGLCYAAVSYGLAPRFTLDGLIANVEAAARDLAGRAAGLGIDTDRIVLIGHSAGAYLAAALACSERRPFTPIGSLLISGLFDLRDVHALTRIEKLGVTAQDAERLSIDGGDLVGKGRTILAVGEVEPAGFQRQTANFARQLSDAGQMPRMLSMPGCNHFSVARELGFPGSTLAREVVDLFG